MRLVVEHHLMPGFIQFLDQVMRIAPFTIDVNLAVIDDHRSTGAADFHLHLLLLAVGAVESLMQNRATLSPIWARDLARCPWRAAVRTGLYGHVGSTSLSSHSRTRYARAANLRAWRPRSFSASSSRRSRLIS